MEDYNDMKKITGSPTAGESEFVHVEPIDSASMNGNSINQDDGIMVTRVDNVQLEPNDQRLTEDGGNEEFVDCPDDLISLDGRSDFDENTETELEGQQTNGHSTEILPQHYQEEKRQLMAEITELTNIRHQLLIEHSQKDDTVRQMYANLDLKDREIEDLNIKSNRILSIFTTVFGDEEFPDTSVSDKLSRIEKKASFMIQKYNHFLYEVEMLNQCLTEVKSDYHMQTEMEKVLFFVREELLSLKRNEFELAHKSKYLENEYGKLMQELVKSNESVEMLKGEVEVHKTKFINTKEKLNLAVAKGKSLVQQRDSLKKAVSEKTDELNKFLIDLQEKSRDLEAANSLNESLLQRDIILKNCEEILAFGEEVEGSNLESRVSWLLESLNIAKNESLRVQNDNNTIKEVARVEIDRLVVSLLVESQEKNYLEQEFENLKGENGSLKNDLKRFEDKTVLLREKLSMAVKKGKSLVQERAEKNAQIEALKRELEQQETTINDCRDQISKLSKDVGRIEKLEYDLLCLKAENNQIEPLKLELKQKEATIDDYRDQISKLLTEVGKIEKLESDILCLKEENSQIEALKRELEQQEATINDYRDQISKLSKDVGRIEILETDILCLKEENSQIEALKLELEHQEATINDYRDQISKLSKDVGRTEKLESELLCLKEENSQIEALKLELKQQEATINDYRDHISKLSKDVGRIENLESDMLYLKEENNQIEALKLELKQQEATINEYRDQNSKLSKYVGRTEKLESDLLCLKEENNQMEHELRDLKDDTDMLTRKLTDALSVSKKHVFQLTEENKELKIIKTNIEEELQKVKGTENDVKVLRSACADVTKEMKFILEKLNHNSSLDVGTVDDVAVADNKVVEEMMSASRNVQIVIEHCFDEKQNMSATIKDLRDELEKNKSTYEKVKEENDISQNRVFKLENEIEELENARDEMSTKLVKYQAKEAELSKQIATFMKDYEAENDLQSTISKQTLEIKHLKKEFEEAINYKTEFEKMKKELFELSVGVEHIIKKFGGYESDADVAGLVPVLERFIRDIILDSENSKGKAKEFGVKLLDTEKVVEELENKIKLFEDINKNQKIDSIREIGDSDRSEISEVEDSVSLGKRATPSVRTLKRETNEQLVLNIDSESDHLINKHETVEDKGHIFKSLHTSGLVPAQGKIIADRLDGLWVSGGGALMSRPRARLGLIAYWVVLHLWLLGTLL